MPLDLSGNVARFADVCTVEEALDLLEWARQNTPPRVDLGACTHLHTALLQVLMASDARIVAPPEDPFLKQWITPLLARTEKVPA